MNAYGPGNDTGAVVGTRLPRTPTYSGIEPAVVAAEQRSGGVRPEPRGPVAPPMLGLFSPQVGTRVNGVPGLPEFSLTPTVDTTPGGLHRAGEREAPSQGAVPLSTEDYLAIHPDAVSARMARDRDPGNVALRNAEHYRFAQELASQVGQVPAGAAVLVYTALKMLGAGMPETARALLKQAGLNLPASVDRPMEEIKYGLKGAVRPSQGTGGK